MEERLDRRLALAPPDAPPGKRGRNDPGVVEYQHVAGIEKFRQIAHDPILETIGSDDEKLRRIARPRRPQRNPLRRQVEIEIRDAQGASTKCYFASAATCILTIRSGSRTGSPRLILSISSMPEVTFPHTVYFP